MHDHGPGNGADSWQPVPEGDPHFGTPGAPQALHDVHLVLAHASGVYLISAPQLFVVAPMEIEDGNGSVRTIWKICGQRELPLARSGEGTKTEDMSWSAIKIRYR